MTSFYGKSFVIFSTAEQSTSYTVHALMMTLSHIEIAVFISAKHTLKGNICQTSSYSQHAGRQYVM